MIVQACVAAVCVAQIAAAAGVVSKPTPQPMPQPQPAVDTRFTQLLIPDEESAVLPPCAAFEDFWRIDGCPAVLR